MASGSFSPDLPGCGSSLFRCDRAVVVQRIGFGEQCRGPNVAFRCIKAPTGAGGFQCDGAEGEWIWPADKREILCIGGAWVFARGM